MNGYDLAFYGVSIFALGVAGLAIVPNPFRQSVRDTLSILIGKGAKAGTSEIERAELRVSQLAAQIKENERKTSDLRGTLNHEKSHLDGLKKTLAAAEDDYKLAKDQKLGDKAEGDCIDKIGAAEEAVHQQEAVVADLEKTVDVTRLAVAKAAGELNKLQSKVQSKAARDVATKAISSATSVLEATKDMSKATSDIGKDLDTIDENYEKAKARLEDAEGSETDRKLEEARQNKARDDIRKRMEERQNAGK